MPTYYRSDEAEIHVEFTGVATDKLSWDMMEGGDPVAEETVVFPGGQEPQVALGGLAKWSPLTIERTWSEGLAGIYKALANGVGSIPVTASYIQHGVNKVPTGTVYTYTGVLTSAERPKYKSTESTDAYLKITVGVNGQVS